MDLPALGLAWARAIPVVAIVPAFGLRALPALGRAVLALALAVSIAGGIHAPVAPDPSGWVAAVLLEMARGLPVAVAAAIPLWAVTMAGGLVDTLRGAREVFDAPTTLERTTPFGILFSLFGSMEFLRMGGGARVALALATRTNGAWPLRRAALDLAAGIGLAVDIAAPLIVLGLAVDVGTALVARAAGALDLRALLAPLRAVLFFALFAFVFARVAAAMSASVAHSVTW